MSEVSEAQGPTGPDSHAASEPQTPETQAHEGEPHASVSTASDTNDASDASAEVAPAEAGEALEGGEETTAAGTTEAAQGDASAPAKRKRKRRKKRKGEGEAGESEAGAGEGSEARFRRRDTAAPFLRFFTGAHAGRKHGFAVGEVVAGRVKSVSEGCIAVDLFGKAMAYADEFEPREVPLPMPEPAPDTGAEVAAAAASAGQPGGEALPGVESRVAELSAAVPAETAAVDVPEQGAPPTEAELGAAEAAVAGDVAEPSASGDTDAAAPADAAADADDGGEPTLSGEGAPGHGPLAPAPIVPDSFARPELPELGTVFRGRVGAIAESGHIAIVNRNIERASVLANLERYRAERRRVQGLVFGFNRGGFDVLVEGVRAFCPASAMTLEELDDPAQLLGHKLEFLLPASQQVTKDIIVSRRSILERLLRKKAKELVRSLEPGQKLKGRVTQVREFGLFVDIGGVEGLVHQSELSYGHGVKPGDVANPGDEVEVQVLRVGAEPSKGDGGRRDRVARVSLSMKALLPDPWDAHAEALAEGTARMGKVTRTTDFGAFIELLPQVEGLLHITELGRDLKHANMVVREGDEIPIVIERVDKRARRISLSKLTQQEYDEYQAAVAAGGEGEEAPRSVRPGSRIKVKVARVEGRGLLVRVSGVLGKRARGYIPASELVGDRGDLRKAYPQGSELEVKVVGIDRDGGLRCSPKALQVDEERRAVKDYRREAAKQGFGTFGDLLRAKLGQADTK
jgi:small subunit ribosomal protein S1